MSSATDSNPYAASTLTTTEIPSVDFALIIRRWERLRIYYNAILSTGVILVTLARFPGHAVDPLYWLQIAVGGLFANLCFLTGPAIEGYGTHFRLWHRTMTIALFLAGLGLTSLLAIAFIAGVTGTL